jgi:hypothetical protein
LRFAFINTPNDPANPVESADGVELTTPTTNFTVLIGGVTYRLELSWETLDPANSIVQGNQFLIYEGATAAASLRGRFVPNH